MKKLLIWVASLAFIAAMIMCGDQSKKNEARDAQRQRERAKEKKQKELDETIKRNKRKLGLK